MAANNYFGFTHSGAQYAPTGATPYQTTQTGYAVAPSAAAGTYPQRAAPAYDTAYPTAAAATHSTPGPYAAVQAGSAAGAAATYDYAGYAVARSAAQSAYDTSKTTYYHQQAPAPSYTTTTDYPVAATGKAQQYAGSAAGYTSARSAAQLPANAAAAAQKAAAAAAVYSAGTSAYAAAAVAASQSPQQQQQSSGGYATNSNYNPSSMSQQQSQANKVMAGSLHRNLSTVAEYTQPAQQRNVQQFASKQVKKTFHPQSSSAVVTTVTMPAVAAAAASNATSNAVTSYQQQSQAQAVTSGHSYSSAASNSTGTGGWGHQTQASSQAGKAKAAAGIVLSKPTATTYSGYDAALYSAATMYVAQQAGGGAAAAGAGGGVKGSSGGGWQNYKKPMGSNMSKPIRQKLPPKPQQLHYCDVCKISCAGPQTYKEHLEGQKHKKKEASMKAGVVGGAMTPRGANALRCELCDVTCTGTDAYAAHIRGAKHQKVVKLHTKLGKPIPSIDPKAGGGVTNTGAATASGKPSETVVSKITFIASGNLGTVKTAEPTISAAAGTTSTLTTAASAAAATTAGQIQSASAAVDGGSGTEAAAGKDDDAAAGVAAAGAKGEDVEMAVSLGGGQDNITPVGHEYIEEIVNDEGKPISFNCKLCECRFNDPNAKLMHMKGRRHRLQFKKKVNPELVVDVKTSLRQRRLHEEKMRKQAMRTDYFRRREEERMMEVEERMYWEERRRYEEEMDYYEWYRRHHPHGPRGMGPPPPPPPPPYGPPVPPSMMSMPPGPPGAARPQGGFFPGGPGGGPLPPPLSMPPMAPLPLHGMAGIAAGGMRRLDTSDDRHVVARYAALMRQLDADLPSIVRLVSIVEKALKLVSDHLADATTRANTATSGATATATAGGGAKATPPVAARTNNNKDKDGGVPVKKDEKDARAANLISFQREKEEANGSGRMLKGVMRVGILAKALFLAGDTEFDLVLLCADKPTRSLLAKVAANLPAQLKQVEPEEAYTVVGKPDEAAIVVATTTAKPKLSLTITLTSPVVREHLIAPPDGAVEGAGVPAREPAQAQSTRDPPDLLSKAKCLEALAALRHAKWFQARVSGLRSCVMVIRILRDLCIRNPTWAPLNSWAMELLAEKVVSSAGRLVSPGVALRRVMEALAAGVLLSPSPGLLDPCEKEPQDAAASLTPQQREDITASAQHALRLMAFRQIHKVLGMEVLQSPKSRSGARVFTRKRRRDNSSGDNTESEAGDGKKDKKDDTASAKMEVKMEK